MIKDVGSPHENCTELNVIWKSTSASTDRTDRAMCYGLNYAEQLRIH